jgi:hypothetical protein
MLPVGGRNVLRGAQRRVRAKSARGSRHVRVGIRSGLPRSARHGAVRGAGQLHHSTLDFGPLPGLVVGEFGRIPGSGDAFVLLAPNLAEQISKDCPVREASLILVVPVMPSGAARRVGFYVARAV